MATRILLSEMVGALRKLLMFGQFLLYLKKITYLDVQLLSDTDKKNANQPFLGLTQATKKTQINLF